MTLLLQFYEFHIAKYFNVTNFAGMSKAKYFRVFAKLKVPLTKNKNVCLLLWKKINPMKVFLF